MMDGQMTINEWLGYPEYYDQCGQLMKSYIREGFRNSYHEHPGNECLCVVIDTQGHRFKSRYFKNELDTWVWETSESKGYGFAWWKECNCTTCIHYKTIVDAYTDKPLYKVCHKPDICYGDMISNPDTHCCEYWEEKQCE